MCFVQQDESDSEGEDKEEWEPAKAAQFEGGDSDEEEIPGPKEKKKKRADNKKDKKKKVAKKPGDGSGVSNKIEVCALSMSTAVVGMPRGVGCWCLVLAYGLRWPVGGRMLGRHVGGLGHLLWTAFFGVVLGALITGSFQTTSHPSDNAV